MTLTAASAWPSVWGCFAVDIRSSTPNASCNASQNFAVKRGSRSDTIFEGSPWCRNTSHMNKFAVSLLVTELCVGINVAIFVNRSTAMRIVSFPDADFDKGPTKSMPIDSHGRDSIGRGHNLPV